MEGDIGHNEEAVPNFLTEQLSALGKDQRAMIEWGWAKAHSHGYTKGICPCGCGRLFWSIGSYLGGHLPEEETMLRWIEQMKKETIPQPKKHGTYQLGAREFTLTYSPKWFGDDEARLEMTKAINKLIKYYKDEIITLRAVGEVGTNGLSHVHCFYKLTGGLKITDKNFKRAWKYWNPKKLLQRGFEGGHHASVKNESDFLGYIDKDIETAWLDKNFARENIQNVLQGSSAICDDETSR